METVESIVIGAGAVGLAIARALARAGHEVVVLEAQGAIGGGTSSRNSEVIHAGLYYPKDSLKARACVAGARLLHEFCGERGVEIKRCGKLVVASSPEEAAQLESLAERAAANGVTDLRRLTRAETLSLEPELDCEAALLSPSTSVFDSHGYMLALRGEAEAHGASFAFRTPFVSAKAGDGAFMVRTGGAAPMMLSCRRLVNSAGLEAPEAARAIDGLHARFVPKEYWAKGNYFALDAKCPFTHLIYPIPAHAGLGVHLTLDLAGRARFGPDVEWIDEVDYRVDPDRAASFHAAIRRYWPGVPNGALQPAFAGVRPKIAPPGAPAQDFVIQGPAEHGVQGLVNLFGIESPGLTSSLAIAEAVCALLR